MKRDRSGFAALRPPRVGGISIEAIIAVLLVFPLAALFLLLPLFASVAHRLLLHLV